MKYESKQQPKDGEQKQKPKKKSKNLLNILLTILIPTLALLVTFISCLIFGVKDIFANLAASFAGFLIAIVFTESVAYAKRRLADKNKVSTTDLHYDEATYKKSVYIGDKFTDIWYDSLVNDVNARYDLDDKPTKKFELDAFLTTYYSDIMQAHQTSYVDNPTMIRLDDCVKLEDGTYKLFTSRTAYYNDLVTNRSMDYKFSGDLTVRKVYEGGKYLTPLAESHMSNHLGVIAHVFYGDKTILAQRGGNATISKNKFTTCIAAGLSQEDILKAHNVSMRDVNTKMTMDDLLSDVLLLKLADRLNLDCEYTHSLYKQGKIKIHLLGLGQLVYTGGKPQFYYAITVDESVDLSKINEREINKQQIDYNKKMLVVDSLSLEKGHILNLKCANHSIKGEAERSFYIGMWHMQNQAKINGIPQWVYEKSTDKATGKK